MQKMKADKKTGKLPYKNVFDCAVKTFAREGPIKLWVGFPTFYARVGTHAMTSLITIDALHLHSDKNWNKFY